MRFLVTLTLTLALAGCGSFVHRIDIQQGNIVAPEAFLKLKNGMTRTEVRNLLGTPLLTDVFHGNRWDYYYYVNSRQLKQPLTRRLTVFFADDKVSKIEREG